MNTYRKNRNSKAAAGFQWFTIIVWALLIVGEIQCIYKAFSCNWKPIGKAEAVYTISAFTGLGMVVGWFDIEDE